MSLIKRFLTIVLLVVASPLGCISEQPVRPVMLDPSNPNAPESPPPRASGTSTPVGPQKGEHEHAPAGQPAAGPEPQPATPASDHTHGHDHGEMR